MQRTLPRLQVSESALPVPNLQKYINGWLLTSEISHHFARTLGNRRMVTEKLLWFLKQKALPDCGLMELRLFLAYLNTGH